MARRRESSSNTEGNKKYGYWWLRSPGDVRIAKRLYVISDGIPPTIAALSMGLSAFVRLFI